MKIKVTDVLPGYKKCPTCKKRKRVTMFNKGRRGVLHSECGMCSKARNVEWRARRRAERGAAGAGAERGPTGEGVPADGSAEAGGDGRAGGARAAGLPARETPPPVGADAGQENRLKVLESRVLLLELKLSAMEAK